MVRCGTLVDATLLPSASIGHDAEAGWVGHKRRRPVDGTKAHVSTDRDAALIRTVEVTTANVHDAARLEAVLPPEPGEVHGDGAFASARSGRLILARGGRPMTVRAGVRGGPEALAALRAHDATIRRVRCRIGKMFGTCKRGHGLRRMRWCGAESSECLGRHRRVVERTHAWLNRRHRLAVRYERRADIFLAFNILGCALVCTNQIRRFCQEP